MERFGAELDHSSVVDYFHIFAFRVYFRRAFREFFDVFHCHLADVYESLVYCIILSAVFRASARRFIKGFVVTLDFFELFLVKICQVADRAQRMRCHSAV